MLPDEPKEQDGAESDDSRGSQEKHRVVRPDTPEDYDVDEKRNIFNDIE